MNKSPEQPPRPEKNETIGKRLLRMAGIFALIGIGVDFISDTIFGGKK